MSKISICILKTKTINKMKSVIVVNLSELQIHPLVLETKRYLPNPFMTFSMKHYGQKTSVVVVERKGLFYIIDGGHRFYSAIEAGNVDTLECIVLDIPNSEIIDNRITYNQKTKVHLSEKCTNIEHMLGLLGNEQGKRNDLLGMNNIDGENEYGTAGKDKFEIACMQSGLDFSGRTLRKLMAVYEYEKNDSSLGLIEGIDNGTYKIDNAYNLMKSSEDKDDRKNTKQKIKAEALNKDIWFKVFNQSSVNLSNLKKYRPQFAMFSPTYWTMKEYRNQGVMKYGQEDTLKEYLDNSRKFIDALMEIMDENGVIVIVIGESYSGGYKSIITQYEMMLIDAGLEILGVCEWVKSNPTPVVVENFFRPANEKVIVCKMKGAVVNFHPKMKKTKEGKKMVKKSHKAKDGSNRYFVQAEETTISNIITTPVFNNSEYKKYDPTFTHDAPCPMAVYEAFVESYTLPGMTCIDIHCGAGQGLEVFARHGCNVVGVDIDPVSVEFCNKRMSMVLEERNESELLQAA
jgi:DNA modification methylase